MLIIKLPKNYYSETVVRKSLYWCDPGSSWNLSFDADNWIVCVGEADPSFAANLHRNLNDFLLREKLDIETRSLRDELIKASLKAVILNVSKC